MVLMEFKCVKCVGCVERFCGLGWKKGSAALLGSFMRLFFFKKKINFLIFRVECVDFHKTFFGICILYPTSPQCNRYV
jgi:hypothetical protein